MKSARFTFPILYILLLTHSLAFGAFSNHTGTNITRTFDSVSTIVDSKIKVIFSFTNSEVYTIRGFYYADHIPQGLTVNTESILVDGNNVTNYIEDFGTVGDVYDGTIPYRWILETPDTFNEDNPIGPGSTLEIIYSLSSNKEETFYCDQFNWVGYYKDAPDKPNEPVGRQRAAFGHSTDDDKQTLSFMNLPEGWSMISLPVKPNNTILSELFPEAAVVYGFKKGSGYVRVKNQEELEVGKGYWILLNQGKIYNLIGQPILEYSLSVNEYQWDMIGGCTSSAKYSVDRCSIGTIYKYVREEGYQRVLESETLEPGKGYWIFLNNVSEECKLMVETLGF